MSSPEEAEEGSPKGTEPRKSGNEEKKGSSKQSSQRKSADCKVECGGPAPVLNPRPATTDGNQAKKSREIIGGTKLGSIKKEDATTSPDPERKEIPKPVASVKKDSKPKLVPNRPAKLESQPVKGGATVAKSPSSKRLDEKKKMDKKGELEAKLNVINKELLHKENYNDIPDLGAKLEKFRDKFMLYDEDMTGDLNMNNVKMMMEKLGQPKTHLELKKMIAEVDSTKSGVITYLDFITMILGKQNSVLKKILMYEDLAKSTDKNVKAKEPPAKKTLEDLGVRKV